MDDNDEDAGREDKKTPAELPSPSSPSALVQYSSESGDHNDVPSASETTGHVMPINGGTKRPLVGVIDAGTNKVVRFVIYEAECWEELAEHQLDKTEVKPHDGWSEQDPVEIIHHIRLCAEKAIEQLTEKGYSKDDIVTLGITNQRATTIAWDWYTGAPLHPAIAWNDIRTDPTVNKILAKAPPQNQDYVKDTSGLPVSSYISALKMGWLKDNVKTVWRAGMDKRLMFGTVDSWILWTLTGGPHGGLHKTDVTNASRALLMDLKTLNWDPLLCRLFGIHPDSLPQIRSSSEVYGIVKDGSILDGIRISGILNKQQSALVGQNCLQAGEAKNTYKSGCMLLYNTGTRRVQSTHGLTTTVACQMGPNAPAIYALEGIITLAGGAIKFLRDNLKIIQNVAKDTEHIAGQVISTGDVYFVPAFKGLQAPHWREDARGIICGLTAFTTKHHITRAFLEAVCFQTRDILEAMNKDCGMLLSKLHVDGCMSSNDLLMQLQADLVGIPVLRAHTWDMSALGVAIVAGNSVGVWSVDAWRQHAAPTDTFLPTNTDSGRVMCVKDGTKRPLVGVIDDGTKTVRFVIYEAGRSEELAAYQLDKTEVRLQEVGWSEQDPAEIIHHIKLCAEKAVEKLTEKGYSKDDIVTLGITNQRETTIAWDRYKGEPLHAAIAWNDIRTDATVDAILAKVPDQNKNYLKNTSGLPISPYFSALKMRWLKDNVKTVRRASRDKRLMFGTVDSWIVWTLTGGPHGGLHITDVTNASRTLLMNLETLNWDPTMCRLFDINTDSLPQIRSSSEVYGVVNDRSMLDGIRISGILGNQQSALVGQNCLQAGQAKNTYRSGCFLLYNTGSRRVQSTHGLVTTVAYKMGPNAPAVYALEGSVAIAGGAMKFLRDNLQLIKDVAKDTEHIAGQVLSTGDVYFVPAFRGLFAPYWKKGARGIICGLTAFTTKHHIIRAALEAVCFQTRDVLEAMNKDCGMPISKLYVDGSTSSNNLLMQLQADLVGIPVLRAQSWDMAALGVAIAAGSSVGACSVEAWRQHATPSDTFLPTTTDDDRDARYTK